MKVKHIVGIGVGVGVAAVGGVWWWKRRAMAGGLAANADIVGGVSPAGSEERAPMYGSLPAPVRVPASGGNASGGEGVGGKSPLQLVQGMTFVGRPDIAARREAGAQAAASIRGTAMKAGAAAYQAAVAGAGIMNTLADSTQSSKAAKDKATELAIKAGKDAEEAARQAAAFSKSLDNFGARIIRGL